MRRPRRLLLIGAVVTSLVTGCGEDLDATAANRSTEEIGLGLEIETSSTVPATTAPSVAPMTGAVDDADDDEVEPLSEATASTDPGPPDPHRTLVATAKDHVRWLEVRTEPNGPNAPLPYGMPNPHQFGGPLTLMVVEGEANDDWLRVQLPVRPNGQTGWIRSADYDLSETRHHAEVDLASGRVTVFDGDDQIAESAAAIGAAETPTPVGTFFVSAKRESAIEETWLGPWAIVLSGYSEVLESFSGGEPVIAIHGTDQPDLLGGAITYGCVRVENDVIEFLAQHLPLGAPVTITT